MSVKKLFASAGLSFVLGFTSLNAQSTNSLSSPAQNLTINSLKIEQVLPSRFADRLTQNILDDMSPARLFVIKAKPGDYNHVFSSALQGSARNAFKDMLVEHFLPSYGLGDAKPLFIAPESHDFSFTRDPSANIYYPGQRDRISYGIDVLDAEVNMTYRPTKDAKLFFKANYNGLGIVASQRLFDSVYLRAGAEMEYDGRASVFTSLEKTFKDGKGGAFLGAKTTSNENQIRLGITKRF